MNRYVVILSFLLATSQICCQKRIDLTRDKSLTKVFNETEIQGLESIIQFADNMVLNRNGKTDANEAYHLYLEEMALFNDEIENPPKDNLSFEENVKYKFLESLDSCVFSAIWRFDTHMPMIRYKDSTYRNLDNFTTLSIKPYSKYMDYLEEVGKNDSYFKSLRRDMENAGGISAGSAYLFTKNHANFDFNIPKNRLWAAIFLLCREDYRRKIDRYFKNK